MLGVDARRQPAGAERKAAPQMNDASQSLVSRARGIMQINTAYFEAKTIQAAVQVGLFELLHDGPATASEITDRLQLHPRLAADFLDATAAMGLLDRSDGLYSNSADAEEFLVKSGGHYLGGTIAQHARKHYRAWADLAAALQDGEAKSDIVCGTDGFLALYQNPVAARAVMDHTDSFSRFIAPELVAKVNWTGVTSLLDVGGARGNMAGLLVKALPGVTGAVFDLPPLEPLFDEHMQKLGTSDRVRFHAGDFLSDKLPEADVAVIGHVLHDWLPEYRQKLIDRTYAAVRPGGFLLIYEAMIDDERRNAEALLQSLNCRVINALGSEYSTSECAEMVEQAGYHCESITELDTITRDRAVVARKDG